MANVQEIKINSNHTFTKEFYNGTTQLIPTDATYNICDNGGTSIQSGDCTISVIGLISFTFTDTNNTTIGNSFKAEITYTIDSVEYTDIILFDVVYTPLVNNVTDKDLFVHLKELENQIYTRNGKIDTTVSGNLNTIYDISLKSELRDYTGGKIEIFLDDDIITRDIETFSKTNGTITINPVSNELLMDGMNYTIRTSYASQIATAFDIVKKYFRNIGGKAAYIINSELTIQPTIYKALQLICLSAIESEGDKWSIRYNEYKKLYDEEIARTLAGIDSNADGNLDDNEGDDKLVYGSISVCV